MLVFNVSCVVSLVSLCMDIIGLSGTLLLNSCFTFSNVQCKTVQPFFNLDYGPVALWPTRHVFRSLPFSKQRKTWSDVLVQAPKLKLKGKSAMRFNAHPSTIDNWVFSRVSVTLETKRTRVIHFGLFFKFEPKIPCIDTSIDISYCRCIPVILSVKYQNTGFWFGSGGSRGSSSRR